MHGAVTAPGWANLYMSTRRAEERYDVSAVDVTRPVVAAGARLGVAGEAGFPRSVPTRSLDPQALVTATIPAKGSSVAPVLMAIGLIAIGLIASVLLLTEVLHAESISWLNPARQSAGRGRRIGGAHHLLLPAELRHVCRGPELRHVCRWTTRL